MAVLFDDGVDDYNTYVQDSVPGFAFTIPVTIFFRYKFTAAQTGLQPLLTVAEPTNIATSGSSFQMAKSDTNQIIAKCQRVGDPGSFSGLNTATHPTVMSSNAWHDVIAQFDSSSITVWMDSTVGTVVAWNKNNAVTGLSRLGVGGVYLFGSASVNVKPSTTGAGTYYGAGSFADIGVLNEPATTGMIADYITNNFSCPKLYATHGGTWKYMALDSLQPGQASSSDIPSGCYGIAPTYSNYTVDEVGAQVNGPQYTSDWPSLVYPVTSTITNVLNLPHPTITQVARARRIGV